MAVSQRALIAVAAAIALFAVATIAAHVLLSAQPSKPSIVFQEGSAEGPSTAGRPSDGASFVLQVPELPARKFPPATARRPLPRWSSPPSKEDAAAARSLLQQATTSKGAAYGSVDGDGHDAKVTAGHDGFDASGAARAQMGTCVSDAGRKGCGLDVATRFADKLEVVQDMYAKATNSTFTSNTALFRALYAQEYSQGPGFDVTKAKFYDHYAAAAAPGHPPVFTLPKPYLKLTEDELDSLRTHGFVVSRRLRRPSFADSYYGVYVNDLPLFVTVDSVLHAFHSSFDRGLMEMEEQVLLPLLTSAIDAMAKQLGTMHAQACKTRTTTTTSELQCEAFVDMDAYLAVARSLLHGKPVAASSKEGEELANEWRQAAAGMKYEESAFMFGDSRPIDYSQLKVRGHYTKTEGLRRFFKGTMWLGNVIDLRIGAKPEQARQTMAAVLLLAAAKNGAVTAPITASTSHAIDLGPATALQALTRVHATLKQLFGTSVSAPLHELDAALGHADLAGAQAWSDAAAALQTDDACVGVQSYDGRPRFTDNDRERSVAIVGPRFAVDSFGLSRVVFDAMGRDVLRRTPSGIDVAFATLGNTAVVPDLADRMEDKAPDRTHRFRDGWDYAPHATAMHETSDELSDEFWDGNVYNAWLGALRSLSQAPQHESGTFHTRQWALRDTVAQLGSWTELRHDALLHVQQAYTMILGCDYPAGMVDPRPATWRAIAGLARRTAAAFTATGETDTAQRVSRFFRDTFAKTVDDLATIAQAQVEGTTLAPRFAKMLKETVEINIIGSGGERRYSGWYPTLFYPNERECDKADELVADVHTAPPDGQAGDPGGVLHQAVGQPHMLIVAAAAPNWAVEDPSGSNEAAPWRAEDNIVYAGPVYSYHEFLGSLVHDDPMTRMTDEEWSQVASDDGTQATLPEWTAGFLP